MNRSAADQDRCKRPRRTDSDHSLQVGSRTRRHNVVKSLPFTPCVKSWAFDRVYPLRDVGSYPDAHMQANRRSRCSRCSCRWHWRRSHAAPTRNKDAKHYRKADCLAPPDCSDKTSGTPARPAAADRWPCCRQPSPQKDRRAPVHSTNRHRPSRVRRALDSTCSCSLESQNRRLSAYRLQGGQHGKRRSARPSRPCDSCSHSGFATVVGLRRARNKEARPTSHTPCTRM